jgi:hypothetical protein
MAFLYKLLMHEQLGHSAAMFLGVLTSEDALFINGVNLPIDGGLHAPNGQPNFLSLFGQG